MNPIIFVVVISLVCLLGFFNEKVTKLTYEISLMLFSVVIGGILLLIVTFAKGTGIADVLPQSQFINIERFLMEGVLCFMLFAGSCHMKLSGFKQLARQISVLAFICTLLGACFYGFLFYGDNGTQSCYAVHVGTLQVTQKVSCISREGLYITALAFGVYGVECQ